MTLCVQYTSENTFYAKKISNSVKCKSHTLTYHEVTEREADV